MTAVEWLVQEINKINVSTEARRFISKLEKQAKEMEKQQGYSEEDLECAWSSSEQNMRFQFSSSAYKPITFKQWLENFNK
jgi:hypothetical protein